MSEPDLTLGALAIRIHGHSNEAAREFWDANWFSVETVCQAHGARVDVRGSVLHRVDLEGWLRLGEDLLQRAEGTARLETLESHLTLDLHLGRLGQLNAEVEATPDPQSQRHIFKQELDLTYLDLFVRDLRRLLERFPRRGSPPEGAR